MLIGILLGVLLLVAMLAGPLYMLFRARRKYGYYKNIDLYGAESVRWYLAALRWGLAAIAVVAIWLGIVDLVPDGDIDPALAQTMVLVWAIFLLGVILYLLFAYAERRRQQRRNDQ